VSVNAIAVSGAEPVAVFAIVIVRTDVPLMRILGAENALVMVGPGGGVVFVDPVVPVVFE
jgi:hypothetical protein